MSDLEKDPFGRGERVRQEVLEAERRGLDLAGKYDAERLERIRKEVRGGTDEIRGQVAKLAIDKKVKEDLGAVVSLSSELECLHNELAKTEERVLALHDVLDPLMEKGPDPEGVMTELQHLPEPSALHVHKVRAIRCQLQRLQYTLGEIGRRLQL